jgi:hypothetical protein
MGDAEEVRDYSLSDDDIRRLLGKDISLMTYPDLANKKSLNDCFDSKGRCIILFLTQDEHTGHWCCMFRTKKGVEFFDPYGDRPEEQLDEVPQSRLEQLDQDQPYLTDLMRRSGVPIYYNTHAFQKERGDVNTCGRHCVVRLLYKDKTLAQYKSIIDKTGLCPDDFVSGLTYTKLQK